MLLITEKLPPSPASFYRIVFVIINREAKRIISETKAIWSANPSGSYFEAS